VTIRQALLDVLNTVVTTYDGHVPKDVELRYAVLYSGPGVLSAEDVAYTPDKLTVDFQVTSVGVLAVQADWIAARCRDALAGRVLNVPGWNLGPDKHERSQY
jgi:hypothetical protein